MSGKGVGAASGSHRREFRKFRKPATSKAKTSTVLCKFFSTPEGCRFGDKCRYKHHIPSLEEKVDEVLKVEKDNPVVEPVPVEKPTIFYPPQAAAVQSSNPVRKVVPTRPTVVKLKKADLKTDLQKEQLAAEISFFKKRYRNGKFTTQDGFTYIQFRYMVTDPEWIFELKSLHFRFVLSDNHPIEIPKMELPEDLNAVIPVLGRSIVEKRVNESIEEKYKMFEKFDSYETIGKMLIRWLDHNVLRIFVEGLRRAKFALQGEDIGLSIVLPDQKKPVESEEPEKSTINEEHQTTSTENAPGALPTEEKLENSEEKEQFKAVDLLPIEIVIVWKNHSANIATIRATDLKIMTRCMRCGEEKDTTVRVNDQATGWRCDKCSQAESVRIREELVHSASNTIGRMESKGCKPVDCILLDSKLKIVCLGCDKEDDLQKLNFGDVHKSWCRHCHSLLELSISHVRFLGSFEQCSGEDKLVAGSISKPKKVIEKRSAIEEGKPLPDMGTCEHYKKSYRWFRFPCCGKVYPCDTCHEVKTSGEHEMKIANRMVCGHCSREQPFQKDKPCVSCGEETTRRRTQFWEGGKGCRDQTKMNKNDGHKFTNTKKKTVSKSKAETLATKKKN